MAMNQKATIKLQRDIRSRLSIATICEDWEQISQKYDVGIELDHFCQAENMDGKQGAEMKETVGRIARGGKVRLLHAPFNELFPASIDPKARQLAMNRLSEAANIAEMLGVKKMIVHSGYMPFTYFKEWHVPKSIEFWKEFMEDRSENFEICIENVLDDEPYMLAEIAAGIGDKRVGICYDVGHANIKGKGRFSCRDEVTNQDEWLKVTAPYLKHIHIHNNDGKQDYHSGLEEGTINIEKLLDDVIKICDQETTITAEILSGTKSFKWLEAKGFI